MISFWQCKTCCVMYPAVPPDNSTGRHARHCLVCGSTGDGASPYVKREFLELRLGDVVQGCEVVEVAFDRAVLRAPEVEVRIAWTSHDHLSGWVGHSRRPGETLWEPVIGSIGSPHPVWVEVLSTALRATRTSFWKNPDPRWEETLAEDLRAARAARGGPAR